MPESLRVLIVIIVLTTIFFAFAHRSVCAILNTADFTRRRNLWFALTLSAFLAYNFWLYTLIAIPLLVFANRHETNPPALFFFVLLAIPVAEISIPGMGLINYLFSLSHTRLLALFILLPAFLALQQRGDSSSFGSNWPDKTLAAYLILTAILSLRETSLTDSLRQVLYLFIDIFLPYYVISRTLKNLYAFRDALLSLVLAIMVLALLGIFESYKHWLLYQSLNETLELGSEITILIREGTLRATTSAGQTIVLGYLMVVGIGLFLYFQRSIEQRLIHILGMLLLFVGLVATLSRGPWIGVAVLSIVFIATGRHAARRLISLALAALIALPLLTLLPGTERVINLLPFIGSTERGNIEYREKLITNSISVIQRNPWFGSDDYLETPEMEAMRQGQGIVDIVNTYIAVALKTGFVGLSLFLAFFLLTLMGIYRAMCLIPDNDSEIRLLGRILLSTLVAILVIIATVSSITFIPIVYWSVAGLGVAYIEMVQKTLVNDHETSFNQ